MCACCVCKAARGEQSSDTEADHEIYASPAVQAMSKVISMLRYVIQVRKLLGCTANADSQSLFDADPLVLQTPLTWRIHETTIENVLAPQSDNDVDSGRPTGTLRNRRDRRAHIDNIKRHSNALRFEPTTAESSASPRRQQMEDLRVS